MHYINPNKAGLAFGALTGGIHLVWAILVFFGIAQPLLNFIFLLHMLQPVIVVDGFHTATALGLVLLTATTGYLIGYLSAIIWNRLNK